MHLIIYTKPGCHLCDLLKADLAWLRRDIEFTLEERNIETDPALYEQFRHLIPVLAVGETWLYPPHDPVSLRRALTEAAQASPLD